MTKTRRKRRFIDRHVQLALIIQSLKHWLVYMFVAFGLMSFIQLLYSTPQGSFIGHLGSVWSQHALFFVVALMIVPLFVYDVISLSHRFVGPVWRFRQELRRIAEGKTGTPILLRKNDFWQELAADFNAAMESMDRDRASAAGAVTSGSTKTVTSGSTESVTSGSTESADDRELVGCQ